MMFDESWSRTWGRHQLVALAQNPTSLFVYWGLAPFQKKLIEKHFHCQWEQFSFYLRIFDPVEEAYIRTFPVSSLSDQWYIFNLIPGRAYVVDFCITTFSGDFFVLLRSNHIPLSSSHLPVLFQRVGKKTDRMLSSSFIPADIKTTSITPYPETFDGYGEIVRGDES